MFEVELKANKFKSFDGEEIYYEVHGKQGEPIIFVYGIGCLFNHWHKQISYFSKSNVTVMYDFRGHHSSPVPKDKSSLTINSLARDLLSLKEHLGLKSAHVVGHSFGCQVVLEAYSLEQDFFKTITLINGFYKNPFQRFLDKKIISEGISNVIKLYNKSPQLVSSLWKNLASNPLLIPISNLLGGFNLAHTKIEDIEIYSKGISHLDIRVFLTFFGEMVEYNGMEIVKSLNCPTLVIGGGSDSITPPAEQQRFQEINPNVRVVTIENGSHCAQLDFPDQVNTEIKKHIQ